MATTHADPMKRAEMRREVVDVARRGEMVARRSGVGGGQLLEKHLKNNKTRKGGHAPSFFRFVIDVGVEDR